jgi:hypothetical protein
MARNEQRNRVAGTRTGHRACAVRPPDVSRNTTVRADLTARNVAQCLPDTTLEWRATQLERQIRRRTVSAPCIDLAHDCDTPRDDRIIVCVRRARVR